MYHKSLIRSLFLIKTKFEFKESIAIYCTSKRIEIRKSAFGKSEAFKSHEFYFLMFYSCLIQVQVLKEKLHNTQFLLKYQKV